MPAEPPPGQNAGPDPRARLDASTELLFAELRRRDPEADVVLLPTAPRATPTRPPRQVDLVGARELVRHVHVVLDSLLAGLVATGRWDPTEPPARTTKAWTGQAGSTRGCHYQASVGLDAEDEAEATSVLEHVGDLLLAHGHDARPVAGPRSRLLASDGLCVVDAEARRSHVTIRVRTTALQVDRADLRRLHHESRPEQSG